MKKIIFIILLIMIVVVPGGINTNDSFAQDRRHGHHSSLWPRRHHRHLGFRIIPRVQQVVYVCNNDESILFHRYSGCQKLNSCNGDVISVTKRQARLNGRRKCPVCF